jgi:DNA-binding MarR family transcriptional regulator
MTEPSLDLDAVLAFIRIAELESFTRAAEAMQTTQAAVSLKLKRLEERLGCRLVERTPRHVQLSARGAAFLDQGANSWRCTIARSPHSPELGRASPSASAIMLRGQSSRH